MSMRHRSGRSAQGKSHVRSAGAGGGMTPAGAARVPSGASRRVHERSGLGHQPRARRDIRPRPAPCLPTHRYSCPMPAATRSGIMMAVAVTASFGDLSHSMITTAERHLWHIMRCSDGGRTGLADARRALGRRRRGESRHYRRRHGPVKAAQFLFRPLTLAVLLSSGSFLMLGEGDETPPYAVPAVAMPFWCPDVIQPWNSPSTCGIEDRGSRVAEEDRARG